MVSFSIASFQIARIFGAPLDVELLRAGDDLVVLRSSMWSYIGPLPVVMIALRAGAGAVADQADSTARLERRHGFGRAGSSGPSPASSALGWAFGQWVRLHRIDTFGVKENAIVYFVRQYEPPLRPIDVPARIVQVEAEFKETAKRTSLPASLVFASRRE